MTIELTPEMEAIVVDRLSSGRYSSAGAVIEEALHAIGKAYDLGKDKTDFQGYLLNQPMPAQGRSERLAKLFAEIDAAGGLEFELDRDLRPAAEREEW